MFVKTAKADSVLDLEQTGEFKVRVARRIKADGEAREINFQEILAKTAKRFDISDNPHDYIIEVIRANTANVPNENGDGFDKSELLSWAQDEGCPVYMTYVGCPHHINHDSENDKMARGIIIDAHYNDSAPAFDNCKLCGSETRHASQRSDDGIHCIKCGAVAKDEWVEIVVATDKIKDPDLAEAKVAKIIDSGSMGCTAQQTNCNVCGNLATDPSEFCDHLQRGNKKGWYVIHAGREPEKIELNQVRSLLASAGLPGAMSIEPGLIYTVNTPKFKIRRATERCKQVRYQEYSAVDRPADPKAEHIEMLKSASEVIKDRTSNLVISARLKKLEDAVGKFAQQEVQEMDPNAAPPGGGPPGPVDQDPSTPETETPELPPEAEDLPNVTIDEIVEEEVSSDPKEKTFGEWGVLEQDDHSKLPNSDFLKDEVQDGKYASRTNYHLGVKISSILDDSNRKLKNIKDKDNQKMLNKITAKWKAALTDDGRLAFVDNENDPLFVVKAKKNLKEDKRVAKLLASQVRESLNTDGLTFTVRKFKANTFPKLAQIMEDAWVNYEVKPHGKEVNKEPSSLNEDGRDLETQEGFNPPKDKKNLLDGNSETYEGTKRKMEKSTVQDVGFATQDDSGANRPQSADGLSLSDKATATHDISQQNNAGKKKNIMEDAHFSYSAAEEDDLYKQTKEEAESDETAKKKKDHYKKHKYSPGKKVDQMGKEAGADGSGRQTSNLDSVSLKQPKGIDQEQPREAAGDMCGPEDKDAEMEKEGQAGPSGVTVNMPDGSTLPVEEYMRNPDKYTTQMMHQTRQNMARDLSQNPDVQQSLQNQNPAAKQRMQNAPGGVHMSPEEEAEFQQSMQQQASLNDQQVEIALAKLKRAFSSKAEQLEAKYQKKVAALEEEKAEAKKTAMESLLRCARIVVKRFELDQEDSPLKYAFRDKIAEEQFVFDGPEGTYEGMPLDLANYLTASAYAEASQEEIDLILERAAELSEADGRYIASLESDLVKQATPELHVKCASIVGNLGDVASAAVKQALLEGNPVLNSSNTPLPLEDKRASVKNAIRAFTQAGQFAKTKSGGR